MDSDDEIPSAAAVPRYAPPDKYRYLATHLLDATALEISNDHLHLDQLLHTGEQDPEERTQYPDDPLGDDGDPDEPSQVFTQNEKENYRPQYPANAEVKPVVEQVINLSAERIQRLKSISQRVSSGTALGYDGGVEIAKRFVTFVNREFPLTEEQIFRTPPFNIEWLIIEFINGLCDSVDINAKVKPGKAEEIFSFITAEKYRAALMYTYGTVYGHGKGPWKRQASSGKMVGNPVKCDAISDYMISMRRRKAKAGQSSSTSSKALSPEMLKNLYDYFADPTDAQRAKEHWCHVHQNMQLHAMDVIAFQCMLRSDNVVKIKFSDLTWEADENGVPVSVKIGIETSKTSQFAGETQFFKFVKLPAHLVHLCVLTHLCFYVSHCRHTSGYLFRNINRGGQISHHNRHISNARYLHLLRMRLLDLDIDPDMFGTHFARRGGAQYHFDRGVRLGSICIMGGWSLNFQTSSIFIYIVNRIDAGTFDRDKFYDPNEPGPTCWQCGNVKAFF